MKAWRYVLSFYIQRGSVVCVCVGVDKGDWKKPLGVAAALTSPPFAVTNLRNGRILRPTPGLLVRKLLIIMPGIIL